MSTTVSNSNPIIITGGTMALGARATIYPGQIKRGFKVTKVQYVAGATTDAVVIQDNSTAANDLLEFDTPAVGLNEINFTTPVEWADWIVTTFSNVAGELRIFLK
jgi:hypothetical protein